MLLRRREVGLRWRAISWPLAKEEEMEAEAAGGAGGDPDCGGGWFLCLGWLG